MIDFKVFRFLATPSCVCVCFFKAFSDRVFNLLPTSVSAEQPFRLAAVFFFFPLNFSRTIDAGIAGLIVRGAEKVAQQARSVWLLLECVLFLVDGRRFHSRQGAEMSTTSFSAETLGKHDRNIYGMPFVSPNGVVCDAWKLYGDLFWPAWLGF